MLNLTLKKKINNKDFETIKRIKSSKHFPSSNREWKSSIYLYNKNNLNLIPSADISAIDIIKNYFSLFNKNLEDKLRTKTRLIRMRSRRYSTNKIYVSNGEFKHTNNKVIVNLYLFNRQNNNYSYFVKTIKTKLKAYLKHSEQVFLEKLIFMKNNTLCYLPSKASILKNIHNEIRIHNYIKINLENYCKEIISNERSKRLLYWYYKQIKFINKSKFTYIYLQYLKKELSILYNKQVEFNLINLKRFYLNSDIVSEFITKKITYKRKKTLRYLTNIKNKIRIKRKNSTLRKSIVNNKLEKKINLAKNKNFLSKFVINKLKYKDVTGFRIQAKGRLTKRYTASRSLLKVKYKGNLLNIDSSLKGLSSVLLKGNLKSNIQYTKLASKSRIGSFGIKGWISGY
jgi:hypothetical protein